MRQLQTDREARVLRLARLHLTNRGFGNTCRVRERARREPMPRSQRSHPLTEGLGHQRSIRACCRSVVCPSAYKHAALRGARLRSPRVSALLRAFAASVPAERRTAFDERHAILEARDARFNAPARALRWQRSGARRAERQQPRIDAQRVGDRQPDAEARALRLPALHLSNRSFRDADDTRERGDREAGRRSEPPKTFAEEFHLRTRSSRERAVRRSDRTLPAACCAARYAWPKSVVLCAAYYCATSCSDAALRVSRMPRQSSAQVWLHPQSTPTAAGTPSIVPANSRERASPTPRGRSTAAEVAAGSARTRTRCERARRAHRRR